ncbi:MAG TPA: molybdopterin-dependent oxidoreductase [Candidatus Limnocylindria bacterium]|nr:molybdopterin-dependent oxidoreductase [Candidatus Limnocylindria bacterium]
MRLVPHSSHWGAFLAEVDEGRLIGVRPFPGDPDPSPILGSIVEGVYSRSRVDRPHVRRGWLEGGPGAARERRGADRFVPVAWDDVVEIVAREVGTVIAESGNQAIYAGSYGWASAGRFHHAPSQLHRLLNMLGGFTGKVQNYSFGAAQAILPHVVGSVEPAQGPLTSWDSILGSTRLMVCFGGLLYKNAQIEAGGLAEHATAGWLAAARAAGIRFVSINPVRDDPPFDDAEWIPIRPNTDVALMLAMAHLLLAEDRYDAAFLSRCTVGSERFFSYLRGELDGEPKSAEWAERITGVAAETTRALARAMASQRTMISVAWALQRADHGEQVVWAAVALAAMLGQIGLPGGGFGIGYNNLGGMGKPYRRLPAPALPTGENPVTSWIPVARVADLLLHPDEAYDFNGGRRRYPRIELVYWAGGNPFHHVQDVNRLVRAFRQPRTVIVHEPWWTATARHADIVLPATTSLERNDLGWGSRGRHLIAMQQAIEPVGEARNDHDILAAMAHRLGVGEAFTAGRSEMAWLAHLYAGLAESAAAAGAPLPPFEEFWRRGWVEVPPPDEPQELFAAFRRDPEAHPLRTPSGRIELFSERVADFGYDDCPGHPAWLEPAEWLGSPLARRLPLHLLSSMPSRRLHAQLDWAGPSAAGKPHGREPLRINPADAAARGIAAGDVVRVHNDRGALLATAALSERLMPGTVQLANGAWYDPVAAEPGSLEKHGSVNVLTLDRGSSRLGQATVANTALVEVERFEGPLPQITAYDPPIETDAPGKGAETPSEAS